MVEINSALKLYAAQNFLLAYLKRNGIYFIVIALLDAELFKILIYEMRWLVTSQGGR